MDAHNCCGAIHLPPVHLIPSLGRPRTIFNKNDPFPVVGATYADDPIYKIKNDQVKGKGLRKLRVPQAQKNSLSRNSLRRDST